MNDKLLPKELREKLPYLNSIRHLRYDEMCVQAKYSVEMMVDNVPTSWIWYILEGEEQVDGDWLFWGFRIKNETDFEEFTLQALIGLSISWNTKLKLDINHKNKALSAVFEKMGIKWHPGDW